MTAGKRLMLAYGNGNVGCDLADEFAEHLRILKTVSVRDKNSLLSGPDPFFFIFCGQGLNGFSAPADFGTGDDVPGFIAEQNRLYIENCADFRSESADSPRAFQEVQIVNGEILAGMRHFGVQNLCSFLGAHALPAQLGGTDRQ